MDKYYDLIIAEYKKYTEYNDFLEKVKMSFRDKRKLIVEEVYKLNETTDELSVPKDFTDKLYDWQVEESIHVQDTQMLFYNLYLHVKTYLELGDGIVLPKEITELCQSLESAVPKPYFVINKNGAAEEIQKGRLEEVKNFISRDIETEKIKNTVLNIIQSELAKNPIKEE